MYSYDATKIGEYGKDRLRFELGDCLVAEAEKTAYLSDEEITATLESSRSFRQAKFRLVESLLRRFSYEVTTQIKEARWQLGERVNEWRRMYNELKAQVEAEEAMSGAGFGGQKIRPPVFTIGMHDRRNYYVW